MGSLRSLRTGHTNYLPRFEVPALTRGTSEEMEVWMKRVWQFGLLEMLSEHPAVWWEVNSFETRVGNVSVSICPIGELQQTAWIEELEQQGYLSFSREPWRIEGRDIYSPKKLTRLERRVIKTLDGRRYLKGSTLLKRLKSDPQQIEDTVRGLCERGLVWLPTGYSRAQFADAHFYITPHGQDFMTPRQGATKEA